MEWSFLESLGISFWWRALILIVVLGLVGFVEHRLRGAQARRWREYLVLVAFALAGGGFAFVIDQVTSRISPEYFLYSKGLPRENFAWEVVNLSLKAGVTAGFLCGGLLLFAHSRYAPNGSLRQLLRCLPAPWIGGLFGGVIFGVTVYFGLGASWYSGSVFPPSDDRSLPYQMVAGIHFGVYLGGVVATIWCMVRMRKTQDKR